MNGRNNGADEGSRCIDIDDDERSRLEKDIEVLQKRICEFEVFLMQMDAAVGGLQKERDKIDLENIELQKENEQFHQEIKFEKIHNADLKNELKKARRNRIAFKDIGISLQSLERYKMWPQPISKTKKPHINFLCSSFSKVRYLNTLQNVHSVAVLFRKNVFQYGRFLSI